MLHVDMIHLAYRRQKYATMHISSRDSVFQIIQITMDMVTETVRLSKVVQKSIHCLPNISSMRTILLYHQKYNFEKIGIKVWDPIFFNFLTRKSRQVKFLMMIIEMGFSLKIDTLLRCLWSRNINSQVLYLDIEHPCSIVPHIWQKLYWFCEIHVVHIGFTGCFKRNNCSTWT